MSLFKVNAPENREIPFNDDEIESIESEFPKYQKPLHIVIRADIRYKKETRKKCAAALAPHFIKLFTQAETGEPFRLWASIHLSEIEMIAHKSNDFVLIKTKSSNITLQGDNTSRFAQWIYRNYCLSYSLDGRSDPVEVRSNNIDLFPDINIRTSPSQRFQFAYFAACARDNVPYNHDVVRYIHSMLLSGNSIVDVSLLPVNLFGMDVSSDFLFPIFDSLRLLRYVSGMCLSNVARPDLMKAFVPIVSYCDNMRIIHFENCGITDGLEELAHEVHKSDNFSVSYWNLSKNKFKNFSPFTRIIANSTEPLLYLNLNECDISADDSCALFKALHGISKIESLKYFYYAGNDVSTPEAISAFGDFLKVASIETLDLSKNDEDLGDLLRMLNNHGQPLRSLVLKECVFNNDAISQLLILIKESETLEELDVSSSDLPPESVAGVIHAIVVNPKLRGISLKLNYLNLHDDNLLPMFRAFLDEEKLSKWRELSFNGNHMSYNDLKNLIPLFKRMRKLESLSLDDNFNSDMRGIGMLLKDLLQLRALNKISVAGGNKNHLEDEIQPFLKALAEYEPLVHIDVSRNNIGNGNIPHLIKILHSCEELESMMIDDNGFISTDNMEKMISAVNECQSLITFGFPVTDAKEMVANLDQEDRATLIARLAEFQVNCVKSINEHRLNKKLTHELPFEAKPEILELIKSISKQTKIKLMQNKEPMKRHSCVCEVFNLPLPFQKMGEILEHGGQIKDIDIGEMEVYDTECMGKIVKEFDTNYPDFYNTTTMGTNIQHVLTENDTSEKDKRKRSKKDTKRTDSKKQSSRKSHKHDIDEPRRSKKRAERYDSEDEEYDRKHKKSHKSDSYEKRSRKFDSDKESRKKKEQAREMTFEEKMKASSKKSCKSTFGKYTNLETRVPSDDDIDYLVDMKYVTVQDLSNKRAVEKSPTKRGIPAAPVLQDKWAGKYDLNTSSDSEHPVIKKKEPLKKVQPRNLSPSSDSGSDAIPAPKSSSSDAPVPRRRKIHSPTSPSNHEPLSFSFSDSDDDHKPAAVSRPPHLKDKQSMLKHAQYVAAADRGVKSKSGVPKRARY